MYYKILISFQIVAFMVRYKDTALFLHYNFVVTLLNDLFGIQCRGGLCEINTC